MAGRGALALWCAYFERVVRHVAFWDAAIVHTDFLWGSRSLHAECRFALGAYFDSLGDLSAGKLDGDGDFGSSCAQIIEGDGQQEACEDEHERAK